MTRGVVGSWPRASVYDNFEGKNSKNKFPKKIYFLEDKNMFIRLLIEKNISSIFRGKQSILYFLVFSKNEKFWKKLFVADEHIGSGMGSTDR